MVADRIYLGEDDNIIFMDDRNVCNWGTFESETLFITFIIMLFYPELPHCEGEIFPSLCLIALKLPQSHTSLYLALSFPTFIDVV